MRIGYARVSTLDQSLDLQIDALRAAGCERIFQDHGMSGANMDRPAYAEAMKALKAGDELVVWRLDRLARSLFDLINTLHIMKDRGIAFRSICEGMDTASPYGEVIYVMASAFAALERSILIERTRAGIEAAKARGVKFGRRPALNGEGLREALYLRRNGMKVPAIAAQLGVGRSTLYRSLAKRKAAQGWSSNLFGPEQNEPQSRRRAEGRLCQEAEARANFAALSSLKL